jgi:hypothetical protein
MTEVELKIVGGPTKPDLQWAIAYPERRLRIHFDSASDAVDAYLDEIQELSDGTLFGLKGRLVSGLYRGWPFKGVYDLEARTGLLKALDPASVRR